MYNKRIGFLISSQHLIPHGGIGQFAKSFIETMNEHGIIVDIITDKKPADSEFVNSLSSIIIYAGDPLRYTAHSNIFMYGDTFCYERMANFRDSIILALEKNLYDVFVCNTFESLQVASAMGLEDVIQIIGYTHLESQVFKHTKNPFLNNANELMRQQLGTNGVYVGTQSKANQLQFEQAWYLPIPISERSLLEEHHVERNGVLFMGRWEEGKNPKLFIDLIKQTNLPAKVMTSPNSAKKFEKELKNLGVDYEVRSSLVGKEKVDFIASSRIAFNPSTVESYGMAFHEQTAQLPTFALENQRWLNNFNNKYFFTTNKHSMAKDILEAYQKFNTAQSYYDTGALEHYRNLENRVFHNWNSCFNEFVPKQSKNDTAKICLESTVKVSDFIRNLGRSVICIDDIKSILSNRHKFRVIYTQNDTYLTKDPNFVPSEDNDSAGLFEGL